ncbi:T9SS type A sorting domain-containing protein [Flavivirga eckloniae]|uniref:Secretion system C-terminal sorting domain-containing protein n=1 Tax=Flavivirga eckloniae TaxID=1803846 RepID=A0A2K9PT85_9FLAO|nr:T9SS type A sorting domain-containing protein [Flavivirga eckloniae]AUP80272.1 hypothetical protein C1H87_16795 [Flavivirga eckloniae]
MKKALFLILIVLPALAISQNLTNTSILNVTKTWSQQPSGYTYPISIKVPTGTVPPNGFPVCIILHGNGGNAMGSITQFSSVLECHVLIGVTGYQNSWNICEENSDAPDVEMIDDLVTLVQGYSNINPNQIRILGSSNGASLANRIFVENTNTGIDIVCAIVSHLNESLYRSGNFYKPSSSTNPSSAYCGYDVSTNPLTTRRYLSISNTNDPIIPYNGGTSPVGVDFLPAEEAAYIIAQNQGYTGTQIASGTSSGNPEITEFSYLSGKVAHIRGDAAHATNDTQKSYIKDFFSDCTPILGLNAPKPDKTKIYPNPTNAIVRVERTTHHTMPYSVLNILGQNVITGIGTSKTININLTDLPTNIYFLKIDNQTIKIIKH